MANNIDEGTAKRLNVAFNYLVMNGLARYQKDVAGEMGSDISTISKALLGKPRCINERICTRFNNM